MTDMAGLTHRGLKASFWAAAAAYTAQAVRMLAMVWVAAMLSPDVFGLFSMATAACGLFCIFISFGVNSALIWNREDPETAAGTAFWIIITGSIITVFLIFVSSGALAEFFHEPRLVLFLKVMAFEPLLGMIANVHFILLQRELLYRTKYWFSLIFTASGSIVLVIAAYLKMGAWSFVISSYVSVILGSIYLIFFSGIKFPLCFSREMARKLLRFGLVANFNSYLIFVIFNIDYIIVGKMFNSVQLGYYSFAYRFANIPVTYISEIGVSVAFPLFAMVKYDSAKMLRGYLKGMHLLGMAVMPVALILVLFAPSVMDLLYGTKWQPAYGVFRILCFYGLSEAIAAPAGSVLYASGKPSYQLWVNVFRIAFVVPLAVWWGRAFGIEGVAVAFAIIFLIVSIASLWLVKKIFRTSWLIIIRPLRISAFACLAGVLVSVLSKYLFALSGWAGALSGPCIFLIVFIFVQYAIDEESRSAIRDIYGLAFTAAVKRLWPTKV